MVINIKLNTIDYPVTYRHGGKQLFNELKNKIEANEVEKIVFDFTSVEYLSTGFSKELFGELYLLLGNRFSSLIVFKFNEDKDIIIGSISKGIEAAVKNDLTRNKLEDA